MVEKKRVPYFDDPRVWPFGRKAFELAPTMAKSVDKVNLKDVMGATIVMLAFCIDNAPEQDKSAMYESVLRWLALVMKYAPGVPVNEQ